MITMVKTYSHRPAAWEWAALILIVILASVLRLGAPDMVEFKRDEANVSVIAMDMAHGRQLPLLGIDSSVGISNAPMSIYIMVLPYLLTSNPIVATAYVGMLNVLAVLLVYLLARRYYGSLAAIIAALLYAASVWAVIYSRKIWAQDLLAPFILLTIGTALLGFLEGKRWAQLIHLPLLAITGQIHYAAIGLIPITVYLIIVGRKRLSRSFLVSFVIAFVVCLPFLIGAWQVGMFTPATLKQLSAGKHTPPADSYSGNALDLALLTVSGSQLDILIGPDARLIQQFNSTVPAFTLWSLLLAAVIAISVAWLIARNMTARDSRTPVDVTLVLWLVCTPLIFAPNWTTVYPHYMIPILPAAYLVVGAAATDLRTWFMMRVTQHAVRIGIAASGALLLACVVITQVWSLIGLLNFVSKPNAATGFGVPLGAYMPAREAILAQKPQQVIADLDGQYIGYHNETTIWNALLYDVPLVRFGDSETTVYPSAPATYLSYGCASSDSFVVQPQKLCYHVSQRTPDQLDRSQYVTTNVDHLTFANRARITAYRWDQSEACLSVVWTIDRDPLQEDFQFAVQFTNDSGAQIASGDSLSWRGRYWHKGDVVVKRFCLKDTSKLAEITSLRLGMYLMDTVNGETKFYPQDLYDQNGGAVGQMLEVKFTK